MSSMILYIGSEHVIQEPHSDVMKGFDSVANLAALRSDFFHNPMQKAFKVLAIWQISVQANVDYLWK